jgi:phosphomannomutase
MGARFDDLAERAAAWMRADPDPATAAEMQALVLARAETELAERLGGRLEFGTAGLRGVLGAGPRRMNRAVVRQTTAGLARYLLAQLPDARCRGVVVGRDARHQSPEFAQDAAAVLAAHGIPALVLPGVVPTPLVAFACLKLGAAAGIMVTASHNPPEYSGYKVYWSNAAQIVPPHDRGIAAEIDRSGPASEIPLVDPEQARAEGLMSELGEEIERGYVDSVLALQLHAGSGREIRIVYTALHGVGGRLVTRALSEAGFTDVHVVRAQHDPDGTFPTVRFPNPEEAGALDLALALAEEVKADLILANDPDADRLAVVARTRSGEMRAMTGNEVGVLLGNDRLAHRRRGAARPLVVTTIASSAQLGRVAGVLGARYAETLTGFKWIANRALEIEASEGAEFAFGYEEALGYCVGRAVRDKDGISAALAFADLAAWCRGRGLTVFEHLAEVQRQHGLYLTALRTFVFPGLEGARTIEAVMEGFRSDPPAIIGDLEVAVRKDYLRRVSSSRDCDEPLDLPASNVLAYLLEGGSRVTLRPSGTEPKIKYYFELRETVGDGEETGAAVARGEARLAVLVADALDLARARGQPK